MTQPKPDNVFVRSNWDLISGMHHFSHQAMATIFEIFIIHTDAKYAEQAAWAAFDELDRLEAELSKFIENSDISRINNLTTNQPLQIGLSAFECLQLSTLICNETNGAFDVTIGSLLDYWLNEDKTIRCPSEEKLALARKQTGTKLFKLDEANHTVQLLTSPLQIDLGGIGKGYAIDQMAKLLDDWDIDTALIHSGFSSVLAIGAPPDTKGWPLTLSNPPNHKQTLAYLYLQNRAVSGSGLQKGQHIIDPRTARPAEGKIAAWAIATNAATADALSTAFMVMSPDEVKQYCTNHPNVSAMAVIQEQGKNKGKILRCGCWKEDTLLK